MNLIDQIKEKATDVQQALAVGTLSYIKDCVPESVIIGELKSIAHEDRKFVENLFGEEITTKILNY